MKEVPGATRRGASETENNLSRHSQLSQKPDRHGLRQEGLGGYSVSQWGREAQGRSSVLGEKHN